MLASLIWLFWFTCLLDSSCQKKKLSFAIHLKFFYNKHRSMKELDLVNKVNKHLGFETSKYIKVDPYVHPN
jgi:hypothetical protein